MPRDRVGTFRQVVRVTGGAVLLAAIFGCADSWPAAIRDPNYSPTPVAPPTATVAAQSSSDGYGGSGFVFAPALASITVGGNVIYRNDTGVDHNVTISGVSHAIAPGEVFVRSFNTAGTYAFTCTLHAGMNGNVSVVAP